MADTKTVTKPKAETEATTYADLKSRDVFTYVGKPITYVKLKGNRHCDMRDGCVYTEERDNREVIKLS